jgi:hypothetical protein
MNEKPSQSALEQWKESVDGELYEELLNRYERILVFAGQLQEKARAQRLLQEKNAALENENERLQKVNAVSESYIRLLEGSLRALGVLDNPEVADRSSDKDRSS